MPVAAAIAGAAVIGGVTSTIAGNKAAKASQKGAELSAETERYMYDTTRADQAPYREVGSGALYKLADMYGVPRPTGAPANDRATQQPNLPASSGVLAGGFRGIGNVLGQPTNIPAQPAREMTPGYDGWQASPGYEFRRDEGMKAMERAASSRGLLGSTATKKALGRYADGLASSEYENYANRLASLAGVGQTATQATSQAGQAAANGMSQAFTNAGNAKASAYANTGSAINSGINNALSGYLYTQGGGFGGGGTYGGTPPIYGGNLGGIY